MKKMRRKGLPGVSVVTLLWGVVNANAPFASATEERLKVVVTEAGLTVEAHGVDTEQALRAIGEQVGFTIVAKEAAHPVLDIFLKDVPLEEALQQLLRGENYAIVYQTPKGEKTPGEEKIGKVVLLSPPTAVAAAPGVGVQRQDQQHRQTLPQSDQNKPQAPEAQTAATVFSQGGWRSVEKREEKDPDAPPTVSDLLETQALQALAASSQAEALANGDQASTQSSPAVAQTGASPGIQLNEQEQMDINEALLLTTRAAQRNLATLVEGLSSATNSLLDAQASQKKNGR